MLKIIQIKWIPISQYLNILFIHSFIHVKYVKAIIR